MNNQTQPQQQQQQQHPDHIYNQSTGTTGVNEVPAPSYNEKPPPPANQPSYQEEQPYHIQDPTLGTPQPQYHDPSSQTQHQQQQYHVQDPSQSQQYVGTPPPASSQQHQYTGTPLASPDTQYNQPQYNQHQYDQQQQQHDINQGPPPPPADFYSPGIKQDNNVHGGAYQGGQPGLQQHQPQVALNNGQSPISLDRLQRYPDIATCPNCSRTERTRVENHSGGMTHLTALAACCIACLGCIPYLISSLKDTEHYCGNCGALLAVWHRSGHTEVVGGRGGPGIKKPATKPVVGGQQQPVEMTNTNGNKPVHA